MGEIIIFPLGLEDHWQQCTSLHKAWWRRNRWDHDLVFCSMWVRRATPCVGDLCFTQKDVIFPFCPCSPGVKTCICQKSSDCKPGGGGQDKEFELFFGFLWYTHRGCYGKIFHASYDLYYSKGENCFLKYYSESYGYVTTGTDDLRCICRGRLLCRLLAKVSDYFILESVKWNSNSLQFSYNALFTVFHGKTRPHKLSVRLQCRYGISLE